MGHIFTSGAHYITGDLIYKEQVCWRQSNYLRGDIFWMDSVIIIAALVLLTF